MTIEELIKDPSYTEKFVVQKLICHFLDLSREEMRMQSQEPLSEENKNKIIAAYYAITQEKKPLEYVVGYVEFFGNKFYVDGNTLIPRAETEYMITAVTEEIQNKKESDRKNILLDIGTGCGVLGISVLLQNSNFFSRVIFTDLSAGALQVAEQNYGILIKDHDFSVDFIQSDILAFVNNLNFDIKEYNIILVANLPYIPEKTFDENVSDNVKKWEPRMAFIAGEDGLDYYRIMLDQIISLNLSTSQSLTLFLEMMTWQVDILRQAYPKFHFEEVKTFHFNIRIVRVSVK